MWAVGLGSLCRIKVRGLTPRDLPPWYLLNCVHLLVKLLVIDIVGSCGLANQCSLSDVFPWRPRTVYRTVQRTRSDSVKVIYCCTGWKKRYSTSRECTEGKLKSIHYSLLLLSFPMHPMKKMSAKIKNDNTFSCPFAEHFSERKEMIEFEFCPITIRILKLVTQLSSRK